MGVLLCGLCVTCFSKLPNVVFGAEGGELEVTVGLPLDLNTRSGLPTDIFQYVCIPNCCYCTFSVDAVATFVVTLKLLTLLK